MTRNCVFVILLFSVVWGVGANVPHRYHLVKEKKSWSEAQTHCREKYTDLASINNMEEMKKLNDTLKTGKKKKVWIGLRKEEPGEWRWSVEDQKFYRDRNTYRNWRSGSPDNYGGHQYCVEMMYSSGQWNDDKCDYSKHFICYEEKNATNADRFVLINQTKTWHEAQSYCRAEHTDLVTVRNQTENDQIWRLIYNTDRKVGFGVWIGLYNDSWRWSDQSNSSFRFWSSDKPSGDLNCTAVSESEHRHWTNKNCTLKLPFVCHEDKLKLIKENLTWKEALNYCRNHHHDLVSVSTNETQLWVKDAVRGASTDHAWLGLRHTCTLGFWYWVTGEMICYQNWAPGNGTGSEDCSGEERTGAVDTGGEKNWISLPQGRKLNFICSIDED